MPSISKAPRGNIHTEAATLKKVRQTPRGDGSYDIPLDSNSSSRSSSIAQQQSKQGLWASHMHHPQIPSVSSKSSSQDLYYPHDATRDSLVENLLDSFNRFPDADEPVSHPPSSYTYRGSSDSPLTPRAGWATPMRHFRQRSGSSTDASLRGPRPTANNTAYHTANPSMSGQSATLPNTPRRSKELPRERDMASGTGSGSIPNSPTQHSSGRHQRGGSKGKHWSKGREDSLDEQQMTPAFKRPSLPISSDSYESRENLINRRIPTHSISSNYLMNSESILARARPIPAAYHDFGDLASPKTASRLQMNANQSKMFSPDFATFTNSRTFPGNENSVPQTGSRNKVSAVLGADASQRLNDPLASISNNTPRQVVNPSASFNSTTANVIPAGLQENRHPIEERKEKHGFFKRVFGSNSKSVAADKAPQLPPLPDNARKPEQTFQSTVTSRNVSSQYAHIPLPSEEPPDLVADNRPVLHKKSSFFRRRRKTAGEREGGPQPETVKSENLIDSSRPSVSSLRQALNPYLDKNTTSPVETPFYDSREHQSIDEGENIYRLGTNSSSYTPSRQTNRSEAGSRAQTRSVASQRLETSSRPSVSETPSPSHRARSNISDSLDATPIAVKRLSQSKSQPQLRQHSARRDEDDSMSRSRDELPKRHLPFKPGKIWLRSSASNEKMESAPSPVITAIMPSTTTVMSGEVVESPIEDISSTSLPSLRTDKPGANVEVKPESVMLDLQTAQKFYDDDVDPVHRGKAAVLLGQPGVAGERLRQAYMSLFDFSGTNILQALRDLCDRLFLKGETQQVDRILSSFSERWCDCNPNHGFKSQDIVHTICYSLLLLNTDMYLAEVDQKMTQKQFIRNTLPTIKSLAEDVPVDPNATIRMSTSTIRAPLPWRDAARSPSPSPAGTGDHRQSVDTRETGHRLSLRPPPARRGSDYSGQASLTPFENRSAENLSALVNGSIDGGVKVWENQVETVLKEFYLSLRSRRLPLQGAEDANLHAQPSSNSLSVHTPSLHRSGSVVSKTPSAENRPTTADLRTSSVVSGGGGGRWTAKSKSRSRTYHASALGSSSRTSFDEPSLWSPSASSTWSKSHYARTLPSMSSDSLASKFHQSDRGFQQSIGFASALSHAIIREEANYADEDLSGDASRGNLPLLEDESLELEGAPWAKEGIVHHRHHLETTDKKARDRNWNECFVVVEKGWIRLFSFSSKAASRSQRNKSLKGGVVGGGNWMDNAEALGSFMLRQTIANALPPPGYSKSRPHVFALSLPTGAVHLFQVGTPEIAQEFVSTANYWSARLSKEPLMGGVSNVEYGWSDNIIAAADAVDFQAQVIAAGTTGRASTTPAPSGHMGSIGSSASTIVGHLRNRSKSYSASQHSRSYSGRPSFQESVRSSIDLQGQARPKLPGDRFVLSDWTLPQQSMMASQLSEADQLEALKAYVRDVEGELAKHNELRAGLVRAFTPRQPNAVKAMANWEAKSSYLLREIVKFGTYIESLSTARVAHERVKAQREERESETKRLRAEAETAIAEAATAAAAAGTAAGGSRDTLDDNNGLAIHSSVSSISRYSEGVSPLS